MARMLPRDKGDSTNPNPYNASKGWEHENTNSERFVSADESLAYVKPKKYAVMNSNVEGEAEPSKEQEPEAKAEGEEENGLYQEPTPYQRTNWKKRYDDLKRHYDKKVNSFKEKEEELLTKMRESQPKYTPPRSQEELEKFKQENPDLYAVVESVSHMQANRELEELKASLDKVQERLRLEEAQRAYAELKVLVPDFEQIRGNEDFHIWAEQQPEQIQAWVYENRTDAQLAAKAINLYKADRGIGSKSQKPPTQQPRPETKGAEQSVSVSRRVEEPQPKEKVWTTSEIDRLVKKDWRAYEKLQPEIDRAYAEGRVVRG